MSDDPSDRDLEDLRLNTLHRFTKHSPRLVLEEYSHCEVPAGCGGVVLRWRDPAAGHPFQLTVATVGEAELFVDGAPASTTLSLRPGRHDLLVHVTKLPDVPSPFGLELAPGGPRTGEAVTLLSTAAGGFTRRGGPDATDGAPLEPFTGDLDQAAGRRAWWFRRLHEAGALLALSPGEAWVHRAIEVLDGETLW